MKGDELLAWVPTEYSGTRSLGWVDSAASFFHVFCLPSPPSQLEAARSRLLESVVSGNAMLDDDLDVLREEYAAGLGEEHVFKASIVLHEYKHFFDMLSTTTGLGRLWYLLTDLSVFVGAWRKNGKQFAGRPLFEALGIPEITNDMFTAYRHELTTSPGIEAWWHMLHRNLHRNRVVRDGDLSVPDAYEAKLLDHWDNLPRYIPIFVQTAAIRTNFFAVPIRYIVLDASEGMPRRRIAVVPLGCRQIIEGSGTASLMHILSVPRQHELHDRYRASLFGSPECGNYVACDLVCSKYVRQFTYENLTHLCDAALIHSPGECRSRRMASRPW